MDLAKYERIFVQEAEKYREELDSLLIQVEKDAGNRDLWGEIHGKVHSIKGMARALSLKEMTSFCQSMEEWCKAFQEGACQASASAIQVLFEGLELLKSMISEKGAIHGAKNEARFHVLIGHLSRKPDELPGQHLFSKGENSTVPPRIDHIRIRYELIEELLGLSQEIILLEKTLPPLSQEQVSAGLRTWIDRYMSMLKGLYFRLTRLRLMPVGDFAALFQKSIRDLARAHGIEVDFDMDGADIQVDIALIDRLREPFLHLLRNAIAHGIEPPAERERKGKPRQGKILLEAERRGDSLILRLKDDGRGIPREAIVSYLKNDQFMTDEEISRMPEEKFLSAIFQKGFTSSSRLTDLSGRGVGMTVVSRAVEYLGGSIAVRSRPGSGAQFIMELPLSLSLVYAVVFSVGKYTLAIPTSCVEAIQGVHSLTPEEKADLYDLRGLLALEPDGQSASHIVRVRRQPQGEGPDQEPYKAVRFAVNSMIGNRPLMVMPVGEWLARTRAFTGVGILENGSIAPLLDLQILV